jgi:hypothetical protein
MVRKGVCEGAWRRARSPPISAVEVRCGTRARRRAVSVTVRPAHVMAEAMETPLRSGPSLDAEHRFAEECAEFRETSIDAAKAQSQAVMEALGRFDQGALASLVTRH